MCHMSMLITFSSDIYIYIYTIIYRTKLGQTSFTCYAIIRQLSNDRIMRETRSNSNIARALFFCPNSVLTRSV